MKKIIALLILTLGIHLPAFAENYLKAQPIPLAQAVQHKSDKVQIEGRAVVVKLLRDDTEGDRHQKFIVRTDEGTQILIVHNIDIAERIQNLKRGDAIEFSGEYIWNDKGGLVHWTHHDPRGHHNAGWIKHKGRTYQ